MTDPMTGVEHLSPFAWEVPGLHVFVEGLPPDADPDETPPQHEGHR